MTDLKALSQVAKFHHAFKIPIENGPIIPAAKRCELRLLLLEEELQELRDAIANNDLVEAADAFCDLQYVLSGAILEFGLGQKFPALFDEVHRSNMSKACKTQDEANQTIAWYREHKDTAAHYEEVEGLFLVYRTADHKALKSINYSAARIEDLL